MRIRVSHLVFGGLSLLLTACGPGTPPIDTSSALLPAAALEQWIDAGYIDDDGAPVVVLYNGEDAELGHIVGAHAGIDKENRSNGIAIIQGMVLSGPTMDAAIQDLGIDGDTTVVFTGTNHPSRMRAWWTFRYWGFDRTKLKVLDGTPHRVMDAAYLTTEATPAPTPSTYSVADNLVDSSIVATLDEIIDFAAAATTTGSAVLDVRTADEFYGVRIAGNVFAGHVQGATLIPFTEWLDADGRFIAKEEIEYSLANPIAGKPIMATDTVYAHCQTATRSGTTMFALLEILGWENVRNWDGAWSEWGNMVETADLQATLDPGVATNVYLSSADWNLTANNTATISWNMDLITRPIEVVDSAALTADAFLVEDRGYTTDATD